MLGVGVHEWVALFLCLCGLAVVLLNRSRLSVVPFSSKLLAAFGAFCFGSIATVAETFWLSYWLNIVEHLSYLANGFFLLWWCYKIELSEFKEDQ